MKVIRFYTYPNDYGENERYDHEVRAFDVPAEWATEWIAQDDGMTVEVFLNTYTWDDTLAMYEEALENGKVITDKIVERYE